MTPRLLGSALFALLLAVACDPQSLPSDSSSASMPSPPPPPLTAQASASAYTPTLQSVETPITVQPADAPAIPSGDCVVFGAPPPTLPETDCKACDMLYSLVFHTNMMVNENEPLAASEVLALETELTPSMSRQISTMENGLSHWTMIWLAPIVGPRNGENRVHLDECGRPRSATGGLSLRSPCSASQNFFFGPAQRMTSSTAAVNSAWSGPFRRVYSRSRHCWPSCFQPSRAGNCWLDRRANEKTTSARTVRATPLTRSCTTPYRMPPWLILSRFDFVQQAAARRPNPHLLPRSQP